MGAKTGENESTNNQTTLENAAAVAPPVEGGGAGPSAGGSANIDLIADQLSASMPDVQPGALEVEEAERAERERATSGLVDREGLPFDPAMHAVGSDGEPKLSASGRLVRKRGRKPGQKNGSGAPPSGSVVATAPAQSAEAQTRAAARGAGVAAAHTLVQIGVVVGGDEWRPIRDEKMGIDEMPMLEGAFADYFEATGKTDFPPGVALTIAVAGYALPRFSQPKTQTRITKAVTAFKKWVLDRRAARASKKRAGA